MRTIIAIAAGAALWAAAAPAANADYFLKIEGVARDAASGPIYLNVQGTGDLDGDGLPDEGVVRIVCAGGELRAAHYNVKSPRDAATGLASGKRTHHPVTFVKEWGPATPQLRQIRPGYNIKNNDKARMVADGGGWTAVDLVNSEGLCPVAEAAAVKATKSRSNVQNN